MGYTALGPMIPPQRGPQSPESLRSLIRQRRIVYGCGRLHLAHSPKRRERLLRSIIDGDIRRFDVAPAYGNGLCERALGQVLRAARQDVTVNTKAGIPVGIYPAMSDVSFPLFRMADRLSGASARAYGRRDFRPDTLRNSLEESLRRLQILQVDTFFLHEPMVPFSCIEWDAIVETMSRLREAGKLRAWGLAGPTHLYGLERLRCDASLIVQLPFRELDDVSMPPFVQARLAFGTFSAFRAARTGPTFVGFLEHAANVYQDTSFIVSSIDSTRLGCWLGDPHAEFRL